METAKAGRQTKQENKHGADRVMYGSWTGARRRRTEVKKRVQGGDQKQVTDC